MLDLSIIILTYNEEIHIRRCLDNVSDIAKRVFIIDSYSTDKTIAIAKEYCNVTVLQNKWENNHAKQLNWGLENAPINTKWVLRLDADEYLTKELKDELKQRLHSLPDNVTGVVFPRYLVFLGKRIRKGMNAVKLLRLFRYKKAICENRLMDEHIKLLEGTSIEFKGEFADDNLNNLSWWTMKHVGYSIREAVELIKLELYGGCEISNGLSEQAGSKRERKHKYARLPLFWRSFAYFFYRYIIRLGFLEGKEGFLWHFMQGWWYRTLVDAKVYEIKKECGLDINKIRTYILKNYNLNI